MVDNSPRDIGRKLVKRDKFLIALNELSLGIRVNPQSGPAEYKCDLRPRKEEFSLFISSSSEHGSGLF